MKKIMILILLLFGVSFATLQSKGVLKGTVVDLETKQPLIGVNIVVPGTSIGATTNLEGEYLITNLNVGTYTLEFSYIGYDKIVKTDIIIRPARSTFLDIEMKPTTLEMNDVVVSSGYFSEIQNKPISAVNFSSEEIRRAPGSAGDVSRIMYGLPSLAKVNDSRNSLIVRGGSPIENTFFIDNIEVPNINHYPVEGSSDGPIGLLNVDFIDDVTFHTGGFSPAYGDRLSSIMEIDFREGNDDKIEPQLNLSFAGIGGSVEGPISSNANYLLSVNKSYLDLIVDEEETGGAMPNYSDAQGKISIKLDDNNKITFLELFSLDAINLTYENALKTDLTTVYGSTDGIMNVGGVNWQHLWGTGGYSNTSISHTYVNYDRDYYETKSKRQIFYNQSKEQAITLRNINFFKLDKNNALEFGVEGKYYFNTFKYEYGEWQDHYGNTIPGLLVNKDFNSLKAGAFVIHHLQIAEKLQLDYGVRADVFEATDNLTIAPRVTLSYDLASTTTLTLSSGIFRQEIPNHILVQNDKFAELKTPMSIHNIVGISQMLTETTRLTVEGYYKQYKYFPIDPLQPSVFIFDEATTEGIFLQHENLVDEGEAFAAGVEVMIQKKLAEDFYGMVSGSYSRTRYKGTDGVWRDRVYDNRFNFNLEGGYLPNDEWEFKVRWVYAGGAPYTPFDVSASTEAVEGVWDLSRINSERLPDYHSLNIRIDKRFYFTNSNMIVYLSVWNAYGRENIAQYVWDEVKNKQGEQKQWSTLPVLGIEYEF